MTNGVSLVGAASTCGAVAIPAHLRRLKGSCVGLVNTRTNSVCKELGRAGAIEKRALRVSQSLYSLEALEADGQALAAIKCHFSLGIRAPVVPGIEVNTRTTSDYCLRALLMSSGAWRCRRRWRSTARRTG